MISGFPEFDRIIPGEELAAGKILSFLSPLSSLSESNPPDLCRVSEEERTRYRRFKDIGDASAFFYGRFLLRCFLEDLLDQHPVALDLSVHGKPVCLHPEAPYFNLSHGGDWILLSFCRAVPVGVDLENRNRQVPVQRLAKRYFSRAEQQWLQSEGEENFIKLWTRKEARLKASGEGLARSAAEFCTISESGWQYEEVVADENILGVVAYPGNTRPHLMFKNRR